MGVVEGAVAEIRPPKWIQELPALGAGLGFRKPLAHAILAHADQIDFLEITVEHFIDAAPPLAQLLRELRARFPLIPHGLNLSPGTAAPVSEDYLDQVRGLLGQISPPWWSDHLAMTRVGGIEIGHLAPVPRTREMSRVVCENIVRARAATGRPFILENIASPLELPGAEMGEAEFLSRIVEDADCGLLLDLMNLHANAVNHGYDPYAFLSALPLERVVQVHVIGGHVDGRGVLVDSHSRRTSKEVWELLDWVARRTAIKGVLIEWDEDFPDFGVLLEEVACAKKILTGTEALRAVS